MMESITPSPALDQLHTRVQFFVKATRGSSSSNSKTFKIQKARGEELRTLETGGGGGWFFVSAFLPLGKVKGRYIGLSYCTLINVMWESSVFDIEFIFKKAVMVITHLTDYSYSYNQKKKKMIFKYLEKKKRKKIDN